MAFNAAIYMVVFAVQIVTIMGLSVFLPVLVGWAIHRKTVSRVDLVGVFLFFVQTAHQFQGNTGVSDMRRSS